MYDDNDIDHIFIFILYFAFCTIFCIILAMTCFVLYYAYIHIQIFSKVKGFCPRAARVFVRGWGGVAAGAHVRDLPTEIPAMLSTVQFGYFCKWLQIIV